MQTPISDYVETRGLIFFARMLDKIRLNDRGLLPPDYNLGFSDLTSLDARFCRFMALDYDALVKRVREGGTDEEILEWCYQTCRRLGDEEILAWNAFITKRGLRDETSAELEEVKKSYGFGDRKDIQTWIDLHDADEGRMPRSARYV